MAFIYPKLVFGNISVNYGYRLVNKHVMCREIVIILKTKITVELVLLLSKEARGVYSVLQLIKIDFQIEPER